MAPARTTTKATPRKVLIDSSVLIAASISPRGTARDLLRHGFRGRLQLCVSTDVLEETRRNVALKAPEALSQMNEFLTLLVASVVEPGSSFLQTAAAVVVP